MTGPARAQPVGSAPRVQGTVKPDASKVIAEIEKSLAQN